MKKLFRLFLCVGILCVLCFGILVFISVPGDGDLLRKLDEDKTLYIPLLITLFAIPSFIFNIEKLYRTQKIELYNVLRFGDLGFAVLLCSGAILGIVRVFKRIYQNEASNVEASIKYASFILLTLAFLIGLAVFIDHFRFHRFINNQSANQQIEDIGKQ